MLMVFMFVCCLFISINENVEATTWDVATAIYLQSFSVSAKETSPSGAFFKSDGTKMYVIGYGNKNVNEYDLSDAWNVSSASFLRLFSVASEEDTPTDVFFNSDGTKMYIIGTNGDEVNEYDLSDAWNVSSASFLQLFSTSDEEGGPTGVFFKSDGSKMYVIGYFNDKVYEYDLSDAWNVTSASFLQDFSILSQEGDPTDVFFKSDGVKMYIVGADNDRVHEYDLSDAWNVSSASFLQNFSVSTEDTHPTDVFFKSNGDKMYITGLIDDDINEYDLEDTTAPTVSWEYPADDSWNTSRTFGVGFTPHDETQLDNCTLRDNRSGTMADTVGNTSVLVDNAVNTIVETFTADGHYNISIKCWDITSNSTETAARTIKVDTLLPTIIISSPTNTTHRANNDIWFNITTDIDVDWCGYSLDSNTNITMTNSSGNWNSQNTSMSEGSHYVIFSCNDTAGNMNASIIRYFTVDTIHPELSMTTPENKTYHTIDIDFNWSSSKSLIDAFYSLNGGANITFSDLKWRSYSTISSGLVDPGENSNPEIFYKDSTWYMINGAADGTFTGYNWTGSTWQADNAIALGLPDIGDTSAPTVFQKDSIWYLISGEAEGDFYGFNWTGSTWQVDLAINSTLTNTVYNSNPVVFQKSSTWYMIAGGYSGAFWGYNWSGSAWQEDSAIISGLGDIGASSSPDVFQKDSTWYMIAGEYDGAATGFNWTGSTWQSNPKLVSGISNDGARSTPVVFQQDNMWYLITGGSNGPFYGYNLSITASNTSITAVEGSNNIILYANDTTNYLSTLTRYFTVDTSVIVTIVSPTNTTYNTQSIWFNITGNREFDWCGYSLDSNTNITMTNSSGNWNLQNTSMSEGSHYVEIFCNGTDGYINSSIQYFTIELSPIYSLNSTNSTAWGNDVLHSLKWASITGLSGYIFSFDNGTGSLANGTFVAMTGSLNWSNVTKSVNTTLGSTIRWQVFANDTDNKLSESEIYSYTITNIIPTITNIVITPATLNTNDDLNVTYTFNDDDGHLEQNQWFQWYINGVPNETTRVLTSGNTSLLDEIICSVKVYDGAENSTWTNSSQIVIGDTTPPVLHTQSLTPATGEAGNSFVVRINVTELNLLSWVYVEITDPNLDATNYTMTEEATNGTEYLYNKTYTPSIVGTYTFHFYASDNNGNTHDLAGSSDYISTVVTVPTSGGGGGAAPITQVCGDFICSGTETIETCPIDCELDFTVSPDTLEISVVNDTRQTGRFKIINDALFDKNITLTVDPQDNFKLKDSRGAYVYEATYTIQKKAGLLSGETYISYEVDLKDTNVPIGQYNYTIKLDDGKNVMFYDVVVDVEEFTIFSPIMILPIILLVITAIMLFPAIATRLKRKK